MTHPSNSFFISLGKEELKALTTTVEEILATGYKAVAAKTFSAADLWNIQRRGRSFVQRRYRF